MKPTHHKGSDASTEQSSWLNRRSLNQRLLILLLSATVAVWTVSSISIYWTVKHEAQEIFDQALAETAHALLSLHVGQFQQHDEINSLPDITHGQHSQRIVFQIWRHDGQLLYRSTGISSEPIIPLAAPPDDEAQDRLEEHPDSDDAYARVNINREVYRSFVAWDQDRQFQVQIAERDDIRQQIFDETAAHLLNIALLFLPILALLIMTLVKISLRPLQQLTERIDTQAIDDLQPIQPQQTPHELRPMVDALNQLLYKINQSFERERRFTANAAHELRTPLAAIRLHTQVLQGARNSDEAAEAALDIQHGVDRSTRLIEQLLVLWQDLIHNIPWSSNNALIWHSISLKLLRNTSISLSNNTSPYSAIHPAPKCREIQTRLRSYCAICWIMPSVMAAKIRPSGSTVG